MSALGQKQTLGKVRPISALPPKADIDRACRDVRFVPKADICTAANSRQSRIGADEFSVAIGFGRSSSRYWRPAASEINFVCYLFLVDIVCVSWVKNHP